MNFVQVLVSAVTGRMPDVLQDGTEYEETVSSEAATTVGFPMVIERESEDSSKEEILTLLDDPDVRMWQQALVAETGFSAANVSRLLLELEDEGQIARYRKGRRKVVIDPELLPPVLTEEN